MGVGAPRAVVRIDGNLCRGADEGVNAGADRAHLGVARQNDLGRGPGWNDDIEAVVVGRQRPVDLRNAYFRDTVIRGAWLQRVEIDGFVDEVTIKGVDVGPLIEAELDRRDPDRKLLRPSDADGFRRGWEVVVRRWDTTVQRARRSPEDELQERVDGEWSFIETLRHLVLATDAWLLRVILGEPAPYHPLGLPRTEMAPDTPAVPFDTDARPSLDEILAVRGRRMAVARVMDGHTDQRLDDLTEPVLEPGYPESRSFPVRRCLATLLQEEWLHREYAERDLAILEGRSP